MWKHGEAESHQTFGIRPQASPPQLAALLGQKGWTRRRTAAIRRSLVRRRSVQDLYLTPLPCRFRLCRRGEDYDPLIMQPTLLATVLSLLFAGLLLLAAGCTDARPASPQLSGPADGSGAAPPPEIRAWMDRLTVAHAYDPKTGFIVARETITLPPLIANAPPLDAAVARAGSDRTVVAFATADRCAPCQQFKRDALNDAQVIARLSEAHFLPTHVEVDRSPELADQYLGTRSIPMTYALRDGKIIATLRGQRSAAELLAWLDALPG